MRLFQHLIPPLSGLVLFLLSIPLLAQPDSTTIRLATVPVPATSGLLSTVLPDFERQTGYRVQVLISTQDIYDIARTGAADLVISHYGFAGLEPFVLEGLGQWPHPVFASQAVVLGPPGDPANIRGLTDAIEAFRRIAATQSRYVVNNDPNVKYLTAVLWEGADWQSSGD
jgi:tungstate transport system substrate-binding protein